MQSPLAYLVNARRNYVRMVQGRRPRTRTRVARALPPRPVELAYTGALLSLVTEARKEFQRVLAPKVRASLRQDALVDDFDAVKATLTQGVFSSPNLRRVAASFGQRTSDWQKKELQKQLRSAVGVDVPVNDPGFGPQLASFTEENVALIRSIPEEALSQVQRIITRGITDGSRWEDLAKAIESRFQVAESRAALIARDQVGKFYGSLNRARQNDLGLTHFFWRTVHDERVRPEHVRLDGQRFSWSRPPAEGFPGQPINCRCNADPDVEALLDSLD